MSDERATQLAASLEGASRFLERALTAPASDIQRAAAIQAFEFTYELAWKLLRARLRDEGVQLSTPRGVFRAAGDAGLLPSVERWLSYLNARNLTVHTYNEATAVEVYAVISDGFLADVRELTAG